MLSARFPIVTPSARVPGPSRESHALECDQRLANLQLIDGGYGESSGLGTLVDLAPRLMELVRSHNERVSRFRSEAAADVSEGEASETEDSRDEQLDEPPPSYVIPIVLFVENHSGAGRRR